MSSPAGVVHVDPAGIDFEVDPDEPIMFAAQRQGLHWPTVCHGHAECTACFFEVLSGNEHLSSPSELEARQIASMPIRALYRDDQVLRLACQTRVTGDAAIMKRGVRPLTS